MENEEKEFKSKAQIYTIEDCLPDMLNDLEKGKEKGSTTHIPELDKCWTWRKGEFNIWSGYANEGKALDIETYIPTPTGFTFMRDIKVGDQVFDEQGNICNVTNVTDIMYNHKCYKITFSDGSTIIADAAHQWVVDDMQTRASKSRQLRRKETKKKGTDQRNKCLQSVTLTTEEMSKNCIVRNKANYSIDLSKPAKYEKKDLAVAPYLVGAWIGDGTTGDGAITSADLEIVKEFENAGFSVTKRSPKYLYGILNFRQELQKIGIFKQKHIPEEYLQGDVEQRLELVKGLMDTDGYTDNLGRCEFTTINWEISQQMYRLLSSLGIKVYFTEDDAKLNGKYISKRYRLRFKTELEVFKLKRKLMKQRNAKKPKNNCRLVTSIEEVPSVPVKCIEVDSPNHMYLCTEAYIPTHNSLFLRYLSAIKALEEDWKFIFSAPEDHPPKEFFDDLIHTISGKSTDKDNPNFIDRELYIRIAERIKENFTFVYMKPPNNTIKGVLVEFEHLFENKCYDAVIIDPLIKFARPKDMPDRDDIYAAYITSILTDFSREKNTSLHLVMHQLTPRLTEEGYYPKPSPYQIKGGGTWMDGTDNILSIWRPYYAKDKLSEDVMFSSQKIKKQKLTGLPQDFEMKFDRRTNRYTNKDGTSLYNFILDKEKKHYFLK